MSQTNTSTQSKTNLSSFSVISTVVCTVIGVGIFYKNSSVFRTSEYNYITVLLAWLFVGAICLCTSFVYSRLSYDYQTNSGYCGWLKMTAGEKLSTFTSKVFIFFKLGIAIPGYCFYAASTFIRVFQSNRILSDGYGRYSTFAIVIPLGLLILIAIKALNYYKPDLSISIQKTVFHLKIIPIAMAVIFGIFLSIRAGDGGLFGKTVGSNLNSTDTSTKIGGFSLSNALMAAPGIMLSYDGFLNAGFYSQKINNPKKTLPKIYTSSIMIFNILYLVITVSLLLNGKGRMHDIFSHEVLWNDHALAAIIKGIFLLFIFISALGLINGYCTTAQPMIKNAFETKVFYLGEYFTKRFSMKNAVFLFWSSITAFWTTIMIVFAAIANSDAFFDGLTNIPTMFLFFVYGVSCAAYFLKKFDIRNWSRERWRLMERKEKIEFFKLATASNFSLLGWVGAVAYQFIYLIIYLPSTEFKGEFKKWNGPWDTTANFKIYNYQASIIMIICLIMLFSVYFIGEHLKKKKEYMESKNQIQQ